MTQEYQLLPESKSLYFDLQADFGITKHMGGQRATRELAELCHIHQDTYVLEVGCGIGTTSCYLAREYGCQVLAVDLSERMIARAIERAIKCGGHTRLVSLYDPECHQSSLPEIHAGSLACPPKHLQVHGLHRLWPLRGQKVTYKIWHPLVKLEVALPNTSQPATTAKYPIDATLLKRETRDYISAFAL